MDQRLTLNRRWVAAGPCLAVYSRISARSEGVYRLATLATSAPAGAVSVSAGVETTGSFCPLRALKAQPQHSRARGTEVSLRSWYIWAGQYSEDPDFFVLLHVAHVADWCTLALPFLALPPGWRFLTDGAYVDVWKDDGLDLGESPEEA